MIRALVYKLPTNFIACFRKYNLLWHFSAIVLTYLLVTSGFDWQFYLTTRSNLLTWIVFGAGIGGFIIPVLVPLGVYITGEIKKNKKLTVVGAATLQASFIGLVVSSIYKVFTGRIQPEFLTHFGTTDISKEFNFGFLKHGIYWGWPSSHAAVAFAGAVALITLFPKITWLKYTVIFYALFISAGAAIGFHWFSDVIAGILIGIMIGMTVGKSFSKQLS